MRKNMGLYRGKRKDTGQFIEGFYIFDGFDHYIVKFYTDENAEGTLYPVQEAFEVIPETVGQYTGHTDMKRKKIFEGDIIQRYKTEFNPPRKYKKPYVVHIKDEFPRTVEEYYSAFEHFTESVGYEVIGNIHDNPELLTKNSAIDAPLDNG